MSTPALSPAETPTPSTHVATPGSPATAICTRAHALYAFDVLAAHFEHRSAVPAPFGNGKDKFALFVTWNTLRGKKRTLRGCIGNFTPMRLSSGLAEYALVAALEDHRFTPIRLSELPSLSVSVSLLTPFTPVATPLSWNPGEHGIHITFPHPSTGRSLSATYLPDVIPEQGWTREEAVMSLIHKAGYRGSVKVGDAVWTSIRMKVYGSVKASATYDEFTAWKKAGHVEYTDAAGLGENGVGVHLSIALADSAALATPATPEDTDDTDTDADGRQKEAKENGTWSTITRLLRGGSTSTA